MVYLLAMYVPVVASFFEMEPLGAMRWAWAAGMVALASGVVWLVERYANNAPASPPPTRSGTRR
jgi:hypothetical protein